MHITLESPRHRGARWVLGAVDVIANAAQLSSYGRASMMRLNGVSAARRTRVKPAS